MHIEGDYAYLASGTAGFEIIDISDVENPIRVGHYNDGQKAYLMAIQNNIACVYFYSYEIYNSVEFIDLSNPSNPSYISSFTPEYRVNDIGWEDSLLFITQDHETEALYIYDISYLSYPDILSIIEKSGNCCSANRILIKSPYCYMGCGYLDMGADVTQIIDFSNPVEPIIQYEFTHGVYGDFEVIDSIGYYGMPSGPIWAFRTYDMSNPILPIQISEYFEYFGDQIYISDLCVNGDFSYFLTSYYSPSCIETFDITNIENPERLNSFSLDFSANCIDSQNDYIFIGGESKFSVFRHIPTVINEIDNIPNRYTILQNHPNPFNAQTTISFSLETQSLVNISIYDITGRLVDVLTSRTYQTGNHSLIWDAADQPSGIYFARLRAGELIKTSRMVLLK